MPLICLCFLLAFNAWAYTAPVKVIATYSILGDVVKNVGGNKIDLSILVGPSADVHTFEPTPKESILLAKANIIFENGLYFEHWLDPLYAASGSKAQRIVVTEGIEPISLGAHDVDPHVWHDVSNVMIMTERIRDGLIAVDPSNAGYYKENTEKYLAELAKLDQWVIETLKDIPDEKRNLVTSHDTLGYFAKRYGFGIIGAVNPSATTEAEDPSAEQIAKLLNLIKSSGVKALFAENTHNSKLIEAISKESGIVLAPRLYTDALGPKGSDGDTYIKMMRYNVKIFKEYLK